jgi:hypothetical protein
MAIDRRRLIVASGVAVAGPMTGGGLDSGPDTPLDALATEFTRLVAGYGATSVEATAIEAWSLQTKINVETKNAGVRSRQYRDRLALRARVLVLEGNARVDNGEIYYGLRALDTAETLASRIGDDPTVAHVFAVRALAARGRESWDQAFRLARMGQHYAGDAPVAINLLGAEAVALAAQGRGADAQEALHRGQFLMEKLSPDTYGHMTYSADTYHPALFATVAAGTMVRAGQLEAAQPHLDQAWDLVNAAGPALASSLHMVETRRQLARERPDYDAATEEIVAAIASAPPGWPPPWLTAGIADLAAQQTDPVRTRWAEIAYAAAAPTGRIPRVVTGLM